MMKNNSESGRKDLTRGGMFSTLMVFSVPFLLANLLQALYSAVDLWVVGRFGGGSIGVAATANGGEVMHLVMSFLMGITTGATVLIGQFFGAGDKRNTARSIGMTLSFSALTGVLLTAVMVLLSPLLAKALNTPPEAFKDTVDYMRICSWGVFFIVGYNALAAVFRGFGNSSAPLLFVGIACGCNVAGDLLLVAAAGMGVRGAALATIASQGLSMLFALWYLARGPFGFKFSPPNFRIVWSLVWKYLKIGVPIGVQSILISLSFIFIISIVNRMGGESSVPAAAYGIVNRINGFAMLPAISFAMAMSAITAQNIGAGKPERAINTLKLALAFTWSIGAVFLLLMQLFPARFIGCFIDGRAEKAAEVIAAGVLYARSFSIEYILVPVGFCTNGFFNGCNRSLFSMINNLTCTFLLRVPASWFFSTMAGATLFHVGFAAPLASLTSGIVAAVYLFSGRWNDLRRR